MLLIACLNVANLGVVRILARRSEFAVRAALGAGRGRLVSVTLAENAWIGLLGATVGLALAAAGTELLKRSVLGSVPGSSGVTLSLEVVGYGLLLALVALAVFGAIPAMLGSATQPTRGLGRSRDGGVSRRTRILMDGLVAMETALALVLVLGAGLVLRSVWQMQRVELGFDVEEYAAAWVSLPTARAITPDERLQFFEAVRERVAQVPGIAAATMASVGPLARGPGAGLRVFGQPDDPSNVRGVQWQVVSDDYAETLGSQILQGRSLSPTDDAMSTPVALVNQELARRFFPDGSAVGQRINTGLDGRTADGDWLYVTIVGVVEDTRNQGPTRSAAPMMYRPLRQAPPAFSGDAMLVLARAPGRSAEALKDLRGAIWAVDSNVPIYGEAHGRGLTAGYMAGQRLILTLLGLFGVLALILGGIGIYGLTAYAVSRRVREIGIRLAVGATRSGVVRGYVVRGSAPALVGLAAGTVVALAVAGLMGDFLFQVAPNDPSTYVAVVLILAAVAALAALVPARRAARVDPASTMRWE